MTKYFFIGLSLMWMTVFYQNCSPNATARAEQSSQAK
jgi:hypothetical protein